MMFLCRFAMGVAAYVKFFIESYLRIFYIYVKDIKISVLAT